MSSNHFYAHRPLVRRFRSLLILFFVLTAPGICLAKVIDFESLNASGNGTGGLMVKNQFAADGILFQGVTALDYSQGIAIPNFVHSGTKAIELCYGAEFCTGPLDFSFTAAQTHVKLWVGYSYSLSSAETVVMRAYDIFGNEVGVATKILGPSSGVIPVSTPLEINLPILARIVRVTVGFLGAEQSPATIFNNSLVVDDIEFGTQGPPPVCTATQPPGIGLIAPFDGQIVVQNAFSVEANITTPDPFATLEVTTRGSGGTTNTFGPVFVASGHLLFANITGMLFPGANLVVVTVKDCFGNNERRLTVFYRNDVTATNILVIDEDNHPVPAAEVYANGTLLGRTNFSGLLSATPPLSDGTTLVARKFVAESSTDRGDHTQGSYQNWKFRVYISNVAVQNSGALTMSAVKLEPNPLANQVLRVIKKNTLIGLHLVASTEWDASAAELQDIKSKLIRMSHFLYNATDGQILIEQADLADDFTRWENSDIRIFANRNLREYVDCPLGGFFGGSFFCNGSWIHVQIGSDGATYAHEFGHYGFNVDDEYSDDDDSVKCTHQLDAASGPFMNNGPAASCMMYWQILASKLCSTRPENPHVHGTDQGDDSCWHNLIDEYKDDNDNPRWTLQSPETRAFIPGIINGTNPPLPVWEPHINVENHSRANLCAPLQFLVSNSDGTPSTGYEVWLHTTYGANILEGKTDGAGNITGTGIHVGDNVEDLVIQNANCSPTATLLPRRGFDSGPRVLLVSQKSQTPSAPPLRAGEPVAPIHLTAHQPQFRLLASLTPGKAEKTAEVAVWAENLEGKRITLKQAPVVKIKYFGARAELKAPLRPVPQSKGYVAALAQLPLDVEVSIEATAVDAQGHSERTIARFEMSRPDPGKKSRVFSADGQLQLNVPPKALPRGARVSVGPATALLPGLAHGEVFASGPFRLASDHSGKFASPVALRFLLSRTARVSASAAFDPKTIRIVEYDASAKKWIRHQSAFHSAPADSISIKTDHFGTFAAIAKPASRNSDQKD